MAESLLHDAIVRTLKRYGVSDASGTLAHALVHAVTEARENAEIGLDGARYVRAADGTIETEDGVVVWIGDEGEAWFDELFADAPYNLSPGRCPLPRRAVSAGLRAEIFERDGGHCQLCRCLVRQYKRDRYDASDDLAEVDHIIPVVEGGSNARQNLRLLCKRCNRARTRKVAANG